MGCPIWMLLKIDIGKPLSFSMGQGLWGWCCLVIASNQLSTKWRKSLWEWGQIETSRTTDGEAGTWGLMSIPGSSQALLAPHLRLLSYTYYSAPVFSLNLGSVTFSQSFDYSITSGCSSAWNGFFPISFASLAPTCLWDSAEILPSQRAMS